MTLGARTCARIVCIAGAFGCGDARYAQTATLAPERAVAEAGVRIEDAYVPPVVPPLAGQPSLDAGPPVSVCPPTLAERLTITQIDVDVDIRYKTVTGESFPMDERIGFSVAPNGRAQIAWLENATARPRVTPLTAAGERAGPDVVVPGNDLAGFVAHDDGFALLTRRDDPGEPLPNPFDRGQASPAGFLVRWQGGRELFAAPLTGTASISSAADPRARDCTPRFLYGRLAWNGSKYGAYILVTGCEGDPHGQRSGDKLLYADAAGAYIPGGWSWNCSENQGLRLVAEPGAFTSLCLSDSAPFPGLNLVVEGTAPRQLAAEMVQTNYTAGQFGSVVKLADGTYAVGWLSRGVTGAGPRADAEKRASDPALLRLDRDYTTLGDKKWLHETPDVSEVNLHIAAYGADRLLVVWDAAENLRCTSLTCFGDYRGTHARLADLEGNFVTPDETIVAVPNTSEDLAMFPNGDVGWAFVPEPDRTYANQLMNTTRLPSKRRISVARLRVCP
jgi:hypothetical protein